MAARSYCKDWILSYNLAMCLFYSFSALLYLNGDFKGGEFLFANPDESIQV